MDTLYKEGGSAIIRLKDGACIPKSNDNSDYQEYLDYKSKGGVTLPQYTAAEITANAEQARQTKIYAEAQRLAIEAKKDEAETSLISTGKIDAK